MNKNIYKVREHVHTNVYLPVHVHEYEQEHYNF
jgi:hypothetical protein